MKDTRHRLAELLLNFTDRDKTVCDTGMKQNGHNSITFQSDFLNDNLCCLKTGQNWIQAEDIPLHPVLIQRFFKMNTYLFFIT